MEKNGEVREDVTPALSQAKQASKAAGTRASLKDDDHLVTRAADRAAAKLGRGEDKPS